MYDWGIAHFLTGDVDGCKSILQRLLHQVDADHARAEEALASLDRLAAPPCPPQGPAFVAEPFDVVREGFTWSAHGPCGEGYYRDFEQQLRGLGWSDSMIKVLFAVGHHGGPSPDINERCVQ